MESKIIRAMTVFLLYSILQPAVSQTSSDQWFGDTAFFKITNQTIDLWAPNVSDVRYISKEVNAINNAEWKFTIKLDFNPSSSNLLKVYLVANQPNLTNDLQGYFVMLGNTQDEISLYRQDERVLIKIIDGTDKRLNLSKSSCEVTVTRNSTGHWTLCSRLDDDQDPVQEGEADDSTYIQSSFFGFVCQYTSTRSKKIHVVNFSITGDPYKDLWAPTIDSCHAINSQELIVWFNESIYGSLDNFSLHPDSQTPSSLKTDSNKCILTFDDALKKSVPYELTCIGIKDTSENRSDTLKCYFQYTPLSVENADIVLPSLIYLNFSKSLFQTKITLSSFVLNDIHPHSLELLDNNKTLILVFNTPLANDTPLNLHLDNMVDQYGDSLIAFDTVLFFHRPQILDILFTEVMADPTPTVALPNQEYLEFYNRSAYIIDLDGWLLKIGEKSIQLPPYQLKSNDYVLVSKKTDLFDTNTLEVKNLPAINNGSVDLQLIDLSGQIIDWAPYSQSLHEQSFKAEGGWSLERVDFDNFSNHKNWQSSISPNGGTPATENSISIANQDDRCPQIIFSQSLTNKKFRFGFDERIRFSNDPSVICVGPNGDVIPIEIDTITLTTITIKMSEEVDSLATYKIYWGNWTDMNINPAQPLALEFSKPKIPQKGDVLISELRPKPFGDEAEYLELYNNGSRFIDLSDLMISKKDKDGFIQKGECITSEHWLMPPQSYCLIVDKLPDTLTTFQQLFHVNGLSLPNDSGNIVICRINGEVLDALTYSKDMHASFISDETGVALERICFDQHTQNVANWTSASYTSGYGTPGKQNSQLNENLTHETWVECSTNAFSPNGDGHDDFLTITVNEKEPASILSIQIFDPHGRLVTQLANNVLLGQSNMFKWDGSSGTDHISAGLYVLICSISYPSGDRKRHKQAIAIYGN